MADEYRTPKLSFLTNSDTLYECDAKIVANKKGRKWSQLVYLKMKLI